MGGWVLRDQLVSAAWPSGRFGGHAEAGNEEGGLPHDGDFRHWAPMSSWGCEAELAVQNRRGAFVRNDCPHRSLAVLFATLG